MDLNEEFISTKISEQNNDYNTKKKLDFSSNQIEDWGTPESYIKKLVSLEILILRQNYIESIFPDIQYLDSIKHLDLSENLISEVENLSGHNTLSELNLCNNRLRSLFGLENLPQLKILVYYFFLFIKRDYQGITLTGWMDLIYLY